MRAQAANALAIYGEADAELLGAVLDLLKAAEAEIPHERPVRLLRVAIARLTGFPRDSYEWTSDAWEEALQDR